MLDELPAGVMLGDIPKLSQRTHSPTPVVIDRELSRLFGKLLFTIFRRASASPGDREELRQVLQLRRRELPKHTCEVSPPRI